MIVGNKSQSTLFAQFQFVVIRMISAKNGHSALETHKKKFYKTIGEYI